MFNSKDEVFINSVLAAVFAALLIILIVSIAVISYRRRLMHLRDRKRFQQTVLETQIEIREQTLQHIAEEIHDNIGQTLSLAKMNLNTINETVSGRSAEKIEQSRELIARAISDLRTLSRSLNTEKLIAAGPVEAIRNQVAVIEKTGVYTIKFSAGGVWKQRDAKTNLIIVRIFQECIQNIIKHADASVIEIKMEGTSSANRLMIRDNGKGFTLPDQMHDAYGEGSGLFNLYNRAKMIDAEINIESSAGGTQINLVIPNKKS